MRPYEVMVILDAGLEDQAVQAQVTRSTELLEARAGRVNKVERWGRRRLAYEINHKSEGYYLLLDVSAEPSAVDDLDRALRLTDEVIRHKIVRIPDHVAGRPRRLSPTAAAPDPAEHEADER
jgi:small subunit ribosomal protein S6